MNIIKRNGMEVPFDRQKIVTAITKANETVNEEARLKPIYIELLRMWKKRSWRASVLSMWKTFRTWWFLH